MASPIVTVHACAGSPWPPEGERMVVEHLVMERLARGERRRALVAGIAVVVATVPAASALGADDPATGVLIDDFEHGVGLADPVAADLVHEVVADGDPGSRPGQSALEGMLAAEVTGSPGGFERRLARPLDLSGEAGIGFWFRGTGSGEELTFRLHDDRAPDPGPDGWELVWSDEFEGPEGAPPDPATWSFQLGDGSAQGLAGWGNQELQYYTDAPENVRLDGDGHLVITVLEDDGSRDCYDGPCAYTSARLTSQHQQEFMFGRVEARVQVPSGDGLWPAFWMLGTDVDEVGWPQSGEIDVMEHVGRQPDLVYGTLHGPGYSGGQGFGGTLTTDEPVADAFHDFAVEWGPGRIVWEFDGVPFHEATPDDVAPDAWVFDQPFFLLLNVAVGGNFGGPVGDATTFPQEMVVDHVRVHGATDTAERFEARFVDDVDGWQRIELPFGAFARSDDQPVGAPDTGLQLAETWGYEVLAPGPTGFRLDDVRTLGPATVAPSIEVGLDPPAPDGDDGWYTSPVEVSLVADDGASVEWRAAGRSDWTVWEPPVVVDTDGTHVLEYRATPVVGVQPSEVGDVTFRLDTTPPRTTASLAGEEEGGAFVEEVTLTLDATDATSGVAETRMRVDGGATTTVTGPVTFDTVGEHLVSYRSRDVAGNLEDWRTVGFEVVEADPPAGPGTPPVPVCDDHPGGSRFPDAPGSGHARTIECLGALGIVEGMADGRFRPADDVSRAQLASFVVRALERASGTTMDPGTARFPDVAITSTHGQAVHKLRAADVIRGHPDGTFRPAEPVTREQTARYVVNAIERQTGRQLPTSGVGFPDVASGSQYARDIDKLVTSGVVSGFGDGTFGPREPVTRGQMTRFVANMLDVLAQTP